MNLQQLSEHMQGAILQGDPRLRFQRYNIDSRLTESGDLFFAIQSRRDGHDFVADAVRRGAAGAVISRDVPPLPTVTALVRVKDTLCALQDLAQHVFGTVRPRVVGITGSIGKTTTKEFTAELLSTRHNILKSEGNFNNHLGLPLTLLRLERHHTTAVLEYAMSAPGEIAALTRIVPPDVAVITNVKPVHLEFFSGIDAIAKAKRELLEGAARPATAVLNYDDPRVRDMAAGWEGQALFFGLSPDCAIRAENIRYLGWDGLSFDLIYQEERRPTRLPFFNRGQLYNFLAAAAVASVFGIPVQAVAEAAGRLHAGDKRGRVYVLDRRIRIIDDSYNSNPAALEEALKSLSRLPSGNGRRIAVLGDMLELGETETGYHRRAGEFAARTAIDLLIAVGPRSRHLAAEAIAAGMDSAKVLYFDDSREAAEHVPTLMQEGDVWLIKGSRGVYMDVIVKKLKERG